MTFPEASRIEEHPMIVRQLSPSWRHQEARPEWHLVRRTQPRSQLSPQRAKTERDLGTGTQVLGSKGLVNYKIKVVTMPMKSPGHQAKASNS